VRVQRGLLRKYIVVIVGLVSAMLIAGGAMEAYFSYQDTKAALVRVQGDQAETAAVRIEDFVRDIVTAVAWTARSAYLPADEAPKQRYLDYLWLLRQTPAITEAMHLDAAGRETLLVSRLARHVVGSGVDRSQDPRFLAAQAGALYFGPVYFRRESEPYMTIALPLKGPDAGVAVAEINLKFCWGVVSQMQIGRAGHAYVVDSGGVLIAHRDIGLVLQKTTMGALSQVRAALAAESPRGGGSSGAQIGTDLGGRKVLTAHAAIAPVGWHVFVEQPVGEAFAPLYAAFRRTGILLLAGLALSGVASLVLARRMLRPIQALQRGAARIRAGSLDERITLRTGDELEVLADEFNRTAAELQESYASLERKVQERTADLSEALRALQEKTQQLEIASGHKSIFLANMSHEFRTPMHAIIGCSEILLDPSLPITEQEREQFLRDILAGGRHLLALINDVLDLSRIEAGRLDLRIEQTAARDVLDAVYGAMRPLAAKKRIRMDLECADGLGPVPMDAMRMRQVLVNLVGNALKFTPEGGRVWVRGLPSQPDGGLRVEVEDTGPGIPPEEQERIFAEFEQATVTRTAGRPEGAGLGLTLARRFVEMHGGRLWVESEVGRGSRFILRLPPAAGTGSPPAATAGDPGGSTARDTVGERPGRGERILLVEDDPINQRQVAFLLQANGYDVCAVGSAADAFAAAAERRPALILMDIQLPGMDGLAATRHFKAQPATREIPVVAVTASAMDEDAAKAEEAGCDGYVTKPCEQALLLEAARRAIAGRPVGTAATPPNPSAP
jgi:signal transduction histidine kinase/ActR/RegA family two-component response regulator